MRKRIRSTLCPNPPGTIATELLTSAETEEFTTTLIAPKNPSAQSEHTSYLYVENCSMTSHDRATRALRGKPVTFLTRGGERDVFEIQREVPPGKPPKAPRVLIKVGIEPTSLQEHEGKIARQALCASYFPIGTVQQEFYLPHKAEILEPSISIQMKILELSDPQTLIFHGGYGERKNRIWTPDDLDVDQDAHTVMSPLVDEATQEDEALPADFVELYDKVTRRTVMRDLSIPYNRKEFLGIQGGPDLHRILTSADTDAEFREKLEELLSAIIFFCSSTKEFLDCMGPNVFLSKRDAEWQYRLFDSMPDCTPQLLAQLRHWFEEQQSGKNLEYQHFADIANAVNIARFLNGVADDLGFEEEERINLHIPPNIDFKAILPELRTVTSRRKQRHAA